MPRNRFRVLELPARASTPAAAADAFMLCPLACVPGAALTPWQQAVYQQALAEAQAVARPALTERDWLAHWN